MDIVYKTINYFFPPAYDISIGISGLSSQSFGYYNAFRLRKLDFSAQYATTKSDKRVKIQMFGDPIYGGRGFSTNRVDFSAFDYIVLHYEKYVFSSDSRSILSRLGTNYPDLKVVMIMTNEKEIDEDISDIVRKYGNNFKSFNFINHFYPKSWSNGKDSDDPEVIQFFIEKGKELLDIIDN